jgi:alkylation response protein AidB-like acyl-CoA dehydrogenase
MDGMVLGGGLDALAERFAERAATYDEQAVAPRQNLAELQAAGLLGLTVSRAFGGGEAGLAETARVVGKVAEGDPSTALILSMQYLMHAGITRSGKWPGAAQALVSRAAVEDGALINALRVEPELGTPARGGLPATIAKRTAEGWSISGEKIYSTGSTVLTFGYVWARTDEAEPRVGGFLVPMSAPGVRIVQSWNQLGMRATESHTVQFENVAIPADYAVDIRSPAEWRQPDPVQSAWQAVLLPSIYDSVARAARSWLIEFLRARVPANLGASLASLPRFQDLVGEIDALLLANTLILSAAIDAEARGEPSGWAEAGLIKYVVTENAISAVQKAVAAIGNPALSRDNPLERHLRNVLCARIHTPQADAALGLSGRLSLGVV